MRHLRNKSTWAIALLAFLCALPYNASAGVLCAVGTAGFGCAGPGVVNDAGGGAFSITNANLVFTLADNLVLGFTINETVTGNAGVNPTTSAYLRITNLVAADVGPNPVNDNIYLFSDVFNPGVAGTAGVGVVGAYGAIPGIGVIPTFGVYSASSQAQMNFLFAPVGLGGPLAAPLLSLTTPSTFAFGIPGPARAFYEWARAPIGPGVVQLVGGLNFQLTPGSEVYMPGSMIVDENDPSQFNSEAPEPASLTGMGSGLVAIAWMLRRRRR